MDIRKVKKLIELLEESDIEEIEIKEGEESVRISRRTTNPLPAAQVPVPIVITTPASTPVPTGFSPAPEDTSGARVFKSPMVGTFYRAPTAGAQPFIKVGQRIKAGEVIGIIEAMKMMNQIEADQDGIVKAIHIDDLQSVEFDQPLITIAP